MPLKVTFTLSDKDISHFRRYMKEARATAAEMGEDSIIRASEGLLQEVANVELPDFIADRLSKLELLIEMLRDDRWELPAADRGRVLSGLAYFTDPDDMIPDSLPGIGYLDDAIMVELIVRELRHDLEGYRDFCEAEGPMKKAKKGTPDDQKRLQERRQRLHRRIRRRNRATRSRRSSRGARISLW
jgi:uncharacterized membrane protein YkvA (DUF1232 family)